MAGFQLINAATLASWLAEGKTLQLADVRDQASYQQGHIGNAFWLSNDTVGQFLAEADPDTPTVVYCYRGMSSRNVAQYLAEQGFSEIYSLEGGFEGWRLQQPA